MKWLGEMKRKGDPGRSRKDRRRANVRAYFTVEVTLVMPMIIGSILFIIGFLLFWYNRCLMEQDLNMLVVKGSQIREDDPEKYMEELRDWQQENFGEKYYGWIDEGMEYSREQNKIRLNKRGKMILGDRVWKAEATGTASQINAPVFLRVCRRAKQELEEAK